MTGSAIDERSPAARAPEDPNGLIGEVLADRYRVVERLGEGAMGTVYRAEHVHMRRSVALKVLRAEIAAHRELAARFEREAVAAGRIEHRNVAKALDFGRLADGSFYLVMEYVKGRTLRELLKQGPLPVADTLEIAEYIASAVAAAHRAGVIHRDLKPDNVMIADRDALGGWVKVLDFGVAKLASEDPTGAPPITRYGAVIGTPEYMAPEQAGGGVVDGRVDLYALGVVLYEMLSGRPPFRNDDRGGVFAKQLVEPPPPLPASIPEPICALSSELLAKDPKARVQTAEEAVYRIHETRPAVDHASSAGAAAASVTQPGESAPAPPAAPRRRRLALGSVLALLAAIGIGVLFLHSKPVDSAEPTDALIRAKALSQGSAAAPAPPSARPAPQASAAAPLTAVPQAAEAKSAPTPAKATPPKTHSKSSSHSGETVRVIRRPGEKIVIVHRTVRQYRVIRTQ